MRPLRLTMTTCSPSASFRGASTNRLPCCFGRTGRPSSVQVASESRAENESFASAARPTTAFVGGPVAPSSGAAARAATTAAPPSSASATRAIGSGRHGNATVGRAVAPADVPRRLCHVRRGGLGGRSVAQRARIARPAARSSATSERPRPFAQRSRSRRSAGPKRFRRLAQRRDRTARRPMLLTLCSLRALCPANQLLPAFESTRPRVAGSRICGKAPTGARGYPAVRSGASLTLMLTLRPLIVSGDPRTRLNRHCPTASRGSGITTGVGRGPTSTLRSKPSRHRNAIALGPAGLLSVSITPRDPGLRTA